MDTRTLAGLVLAERKKKGLTQVQLAEMAGISRGSLRRIEEAVGECRASTVDKVAAALGRSPRWFWSRVT